MICEQFNTDSANLVGDDDTEEEALTILRNAVAKHGPQVMADVALSQIDERRRDHRHCVRC